MEPDRLELVDVRSGYGRIEVLRDVSLKVPPGAIVALLGSNGAGKTTTLSTIAGMLPAHAGDVLLDGQSIRRLSTYQRAKSGIVLIPQGRSVFPSLSVRDNLQVMARADGGRVAANRAQRLN
ncbi:MAG: ATP-binding cassette domain-containing protein, partial [Pseudonocardiaceae bacterium]|nr:ATP-binding cassette domain-containing protein [Pseudonocardiaceae bacterium]